MTRWRTYLILAWKLTPKRVVIQIIRTMVAKAVKVTRTVNIFRNPLSQRATGEERRVEMRIRKAKSPLVVNREEVLALAKVKAPIARNANQKSKESSGSKQGRSARSGKGKSANSGTAASKDKGKKDNVASSSKQQQRPGKKNQRR